MRIHGLASKIRRVHRSPILLLRRLVFLTAPWKRQALRFQARLHGWVLAMPMIARADMKRFLAVEVVFNVGLLASALVAASEVRLLEIIGVGFLILYIGNLTYAFHYAHTRCHFAVDRGTAIRWVLGLFLLIAASLHTWQDIHVQWRVATAWILSAIVFSLLSVNAADRRDLVLAIRGEGRYDAE
jgi:hypothetical protein